MTPNSKHVKFGAARALLFAVILILIETLSVCVMAQELLVLPDEWRESVFEKEDRAKARFLHL